VPAPEPLVQDPLFEAGSLNAGPFRFFWVGKGTSTCRGLMLVA
jgi:hypothetical protein